MVFFGRLCDSPSSFWTIFLEKLYKQEDLEGFCCLGLKNDLMDSPNKCDVITLTPHSSTRREKKLEKGASWKHICHLSTKKNQSSIWQWYFTKIGSAKSRPCSCWFSGRVFLPVSKIDRFSGRELLKTDVAEEEKLAKDGILTSSWTPYQLQGPGPMTPLLGDQITPVSHVFLAINV